MRTPLLRVAMGAALTFAIAGCSQTTATASPAFTPMPPAQATATGAASAPAATSAATQLGLGGSWNGTWRDTSPDQSSGTFALTWTQAGLSLSGTIKVSGTPCLTDGTVTGTISGSTISFGAVSGQVQIKYNGSVSGNAMQGTYSAPTCGDAKGNWTATKS
jgi:hypothetical protein